MAAGSTLEGIPTLGNCAAQNPGKHPAGSGSSWIPDPVNTVEIFTNIHSLFGVLLPQKIFCASACDSPAAQPNCVCSVHRAIKAFCSCLRQCGFLLFSFPVKHWIMGFPLIRPNWSVPLPLVVRWAVTSFHLQLKPNYVSNITVQIMAKLPADDMRWTKEAEEVFCVLFVPLTAYRIPPGLWGPGPWLPAVGKWPSLSWDLSKQK